MRDLTSVIRSGRRMARLISNARDNGGDTIYISRRHGRYVVGGKRTVDHATIGGLMAMTSARRADTIGTWLEADGTITADIGTLHRTLNDAMATARTRGERAIYDRHTDTCITVG